MLIIPQLFAEVFGVTSENGTKQTTLFSVKESESLTAQLSPDRPVLIVSSTSWTADEDFDKMLDAMTMLDEKIGQQVGKTSRFEFIVTGKGEMRAHYEEKMRQMKLKHCHIRTAWLSAENYPKLLASCDLGVCLHYSSSGVDLPMKVVDMFGSELPVCAVQFRALPELVKHEQNGLIFSTAQDLANQIFVRLTVIA